MLERLARYALLYRRFDLVEDITLVRRASSKSCGDAERSTKECSKLHVGDLAVRTIWSGKSRENDEDFYRF